MLRINISGNAVAIKTAPTTSGPPASRIIDPVVQSVPMPNSANQENK